MANRLIPGTAPNPVSALGFDGSDFRVITVNTDGTMSVSANLVGSEGKPFKTTVSGYLIVYPGFYGGLFTPLATDVVNRIRAVIEDTVLPSGASTAAKQDEQTTKLNLIAALRNALTSVGGDSLAVFDYYTQRLSNALSSVGADKVRTSVIDSALPTGAATENTLNTAKADLDLLVKALYSFNTDSLMVKVVSNPPQQVQGSNAVPLKQDGNDYLMSADQYLKTTLESVHTDKLLVKAYTDGSAYKQARVDSNSNIVLSPADYLGNHQLAYYDRYEELNVDLNPAAGPNTKTLTAVPAGEVWVITNLWAIDSTTAKSTLLRLHLGNNNHQIQYFTQTNTLVGNMRGGQWILKEGDYANCIFVDNVSGDDLYFGASGYKFKVA
jgi:hypothetical protein